MFRIIDYRNHSGKITITIETDDSTSALLLRLFRSVAPIPYPDGIPPGAVSKIQIRTNGTNEGKPEILQEIRELATKEKDSISVAAERLLFIDLTYPHCDKPNTP